MAIVDSESIRMQKSFERRVQAGKECRILYNIIIIGTVPVEIGGNAGRLGVLMGFNRLHHDNPYLADANAQALYYLVHDHIFLGKPG